MNERLPEFDRDEVIVRMGAGFQRIARGNAVRAPNLFLVARRPSAE